MYKLFKSVVLSILLVLMFTLPALAKDFPTQQDVALDKEWRIKFSRPVDSSTLGSIHILCTDTNPMTLFSATPVIDPKDENSVLLKHTIPFVSGANYRVMVGTGVKDSSGDNLTDVAGLAFRAKPAINPPGNLTAIAISSSEIAIQWDQVTGSDYYYVYASDDGLSFKYVVNSDGSQFQYKWAPIYSLKLSGMNANTIKYFKVSAVKDGVASDCSNIVHATTLSSLVTPDLVESSIDGTFTGWTGDTIFKLSNGQIWQQSSFAYIYHWAYSPKVMIYKSGTAYKMKVDGVDSEINVTRLK